jgi:RNA chaperone Hfq
VKIPADPKSRQFLQLNRYRRERSSVHVYLLSGTRFTGRIRSFDVHTLLLETQQGMMVIYTHAISTIEQAVAQRPRGRPSTGPARRDDGMAPGRPSDRAGGYERRTWNPADMPRDDPDVELPVNPPLRNVAPPPTVTIVRRKSRLVPPRSDQ